MAEQDVEKQDGRTDFDFLVGQWNVHHRWLKSPASWEECEGTMVNHKILAGLGNIEEHSIDRASGRIEAIALRLFNPKSQQWSIYWADSVYGTLDTAVIGEFMQGCGEFYAQEIFNERHIFLRFIWSGITPISCRWEQAFSHDGGKTWETNWIMEFTRRQGIIAENAMGLSLPQ